MEAFPKIHFHRIYIHFQPWTTTAFCQFIGHSLLHEKYAEKGFRQALKDAANFPCRACRRPASCTSSVIL